MNKVRRVHKGELSWDMESTGNQVHEEEKKISEDNIGRDFNALQIEGAEE